MLMTGYNAFTQEHTLIGWQYFRFVRYADEVGIPMEKEADQHDSGTMSISHFVHALHRFTWSRYLKFTYSEIVRPGLRTKNISRSWLKVVGMKLNIKQDGKIGKEAIFDRWQERIALPVILAWLKDKGKEISFESILDVLHTRLSARINYDLLGGAHSEAVKHYATAQLRIQVAQFLRQRRGKEEGEKTKSTGERSY